MQVIIGSYAIDEGENEAFGGRPWYRHIHHFHVHICDKIMREVRLCKRQQLVQSDRQVY